MLLKPFNQLDSRFQNEEVKYYYEILSRKKAQLILKRAIDIIGSSLLILLLSPLLLLLPVMIKLDSAGPVFFRQVRVKQYGKEFRIFKYRTMVQNAEALGTQVTVSGDKRITRVGKLLRKVRLDEIPQLFNIWLGEMSFLGTRPEVPRYVAHYTNQMMATLLLPPGLTSTASIEFRNEDELLDASEDPDTTYINEILPIKMKYNLEYIENLNAFGDIGIAFKTIFYVFLKRS